METTDANLIAAAPDMLEALFGILDYANEQLADVGADIEASGGVMQDTHRATIKRWSAVCQAINKAIGATS